MQLFISRTLARYSFILFLTILSFSCGEVFEEDISDQVVDLISPADSTEVYTSNIQFVWDNVQDAIEYELQVVEPTFDNPSNFVIDSLLQEESVFISLNSGTYEWRVKARNNSSETGWFSNVLHVQADTTGSIDGEILNILSPSNNLITSSEVVLFQWQLIENAHYYTVDFYTNNDGELGDWDGNINTSNIDSISVALSEGSWTYRIQGHTLNGQSSSDFGERNIVVDRSPPTQPVLIAPLNVTVSFDTLLNFSWTSGIDEWSTTSDSIFIYENGLVGNGVDSMAVDSESTAIDLQTYPSGSYYWRIKTRDALGFGSSSASGVFIVVD